MVSDRRRVLIVANRTVATPMLVDAVRRRASAQPCSFALLVPYVGRREDADWPLAWLFALLEEAGGTHVESLGHGEHAVQAVDVQLRRGEFDEVILSTWPRRPSLWPLRTRAGDPPLPLSGGSRTSVAVARPSEGALPGRRRGRRMLQSHVTGGQRTARGCCGGQ